MAWLITSKSGEGFDPCHEVETANTAYGARSTVYGDN